MRQNGTPRRLRRDCRSPRSVPVALLPFLSAASIAAGTALPTTARANDPTPTVIPASPPAATAGVSAALAEPVPRIVFAGNPLPIATPDLAPYRDPTDGVLCVSPQSLSPLGVTYIVDRTANVVSFSGPDGVANATVPLRTPPANLPGVARRGPFVPATDTIEGLGGKCQWYPATNTLAARAILTSIEILGGQLRIQATLPVSPTITDQHDGHRIIVDVPGSEIGKLPHTIDLQSPIVTGGRVGQFNDDTSRIVLEMKHPFAFSVLGGKPSLTMVLNPTAPSNAAIIASAAAPPPAATGKPAGHGKTAPVSIVSGVTYKKVSDVEAQFVISADRAPTIRAGLTNGRLTLDLLNATLGSHAADLANFAHPFLKEAHLIANGTSAAQLVLDLTRAVVFTIRPSDKGPVELDLSLPRGAVGKLAGKTIVVDPGHGGHDSGAMGVNGTAEKSVNLQIATQVAATLRDAGANVILTRSSDYFIPVDDRPAIANRAGADFFVSVHADSGDRNHSVAGSTVYYHFNQPSCKTLAQCIADRLSGNSDIHSRGVGSDGIRFPGHGYGVLRNSQMVAVLVECGYMSNMGDVRKLNTPATQQKIALAVVNGLRDYIEGNPHTDTRNINPQVGGGITPALPSFGGTDSPATNPGNNGPLGIPNPDAPAGTVPQPVPNTTPGNNDNPPVPVVPPVIPDDSIAGPQ